MFRRMILLGFVALVAATSRPSVSNADVVTFDLTEGGSGGTFDFDMDSGTFPDPSGLVAIFEAVVIGNTGVLNATGAGLGVNAENGVFPGSGDEASQLDGNQGLESIQITFAGPVSAILTEVGIAGLGTDDSGSIAIGAEVNAIGSGTSTVIPDHTNLVGETLTIAFTAGNGFSVNSLTFEVRAVPEPSSFLLVGILGLGAFARRRR